MQALSYKQREEALTKMGDEGVDILIVGGGITGAGVAVDAVARGYKVGLVDKGDFASGTSSKSTKLVHGGIRYLPQFDFALVREALTERGLLTRNAPFLVQPLAFVLPIYKDAKRPLGTPIVPPFGIGMGYLIRAGLVMYDVLAGRLGVGLHKHITLESAERAIPCLKTEGLKNVFIYYDAQTDDTRLTNAVIRTAADRGALIASYSEVTGFDQENGKITRAHVRDTLSGREVTVNAGTVVNAAGVFAGRVEMLAGSEAESQVHIKPAKGIHLTMPRSALNMKGRTAVVLPETEDGRLLFIVPWGPRVTVGTTDTPGGDIDAPRAEKDEIEYLLRHVNRYMKCNVTEADVISAWAGYRPLVSSRKPDAASSRLSRSHVVVDGPGGMVTIVGGKLTTYRRMAQDTLDHIAHRTGKPIDHVTEHLPLEGAEGWKESAERLKEAAPRFGLKPDTLRRLNTYGSSADTILDLLKSDGSLSARVVPDLPYIMAEVVFACRYEMAMELDDVLERRLHVNFEDWQRGYGAAPAVAAVMARELGWDSAETERQVDAYRKRLQVSPSPGHNGASDKSSAEPGAVMPEQIKRS